MRSVLVFLLIALLALKVAAPDAPEYAAWIVAAVIPVWLAFWALLAIAKHGVANSLREGAYRMIALAEMIDGAEPTFRAYLEAVAKREARVE